MSTIINTDVLTPVLSNAVKAYRDETFPQGPKSFSLRHGPEGYYRSVKITEAIEEFTRTNNSSGLLVLLYVMVSNPNQHTLQQYITEALFPKQKPSDAAEATKTEVAPANSPDVFNREALENKMEGARVLVNSFGYGPMFFLSPKITRPRAAQSLIVEELLRKHVIGCEEELKAKVPGILATLNNPKIEHATPEWLTQFSMTPKQAMPRVSSIGS